jgi:hypothetical protein
MRALRFLVLAATLLCCGTAAAQFGQTPAPGQTPSYGKTIVPGITPGFTPGQTVPPSLQKHAPVCPDEAHIRLPQNNGPSPAEWITTRVFGNCSDPDGKDDTARLVYSSPNVFPEHINWGLGDQKSNQVTYINLTPQPGYAGPDFMQYYAIDGDGRTNSNTTDFYIEVVAGLKEASAVWTGTSRADALEGTALADTITTYAGDDTITDTKSGVVSRAVGRAAKAKGFVNRVNAGPGNDKVNVRNHKRDKVDCGKGKKDRVTADKADVLKHCEKVKRKK